MRHPRNRVPCSGRRLSSSTYRRARSRRPCRQLTQFLQPGHQVKPSRRSHHRVASSDHQPRHRYAVQTYRPCHQGRRSAGPAYRRGGRTRCRRFRRGLRGCPRRLLLGFGGRRLGGRGGVLARARCRRWIGRPRTGCRRRGGSGRPGRSPRPVGCSWEWTAAVRTAGWPGATGRRPRTGTRWRRPRTARSPRTGTRRCRGVRTGVVRAGPVVGFPPQGSTGCRTATSARRRGSPSCVACTGCCRTRTLFRCSLHCLAPKTCLTIRLTGAPRIVRRHDKVGSTRSDRP